MRTRLMLVAVTLAVGLAMLAWPADVFAQHRGGGDGQRGGSGGGQAVARPQGAPPPGAGRPAGGSAGARPQGSPPPGAGRPAGGGYGGGYAVRRPPGAGRPPGYGGARGGYGYGSYYRPYYGYGSYYGYRPYYGSSFYFGWGLGSYPYYSNPYWYGYGYGGYPRWTSPYYGYGTGYYGGYGTDYYGGYGADYYGGSSLKLDVKPNDTEVYVDGHYAGVADDFDGFTQSLSVEPGGHDITLYRDGFKSVRQNVYFRPAETSRLRCEMVRLQPGEPPDQRPVAGIPDSLMSVPVDRRASQQQPYQGQPPQSYAPRVEMQPPPRPAAQDADASNFGQVAIRVQPAGAQIFIDGEAWQSPQGLGRLVVHLPPGVHTVEIRKDGFEPFKTDVQVRQGEIAPLNVSLNGRGAQ